MDEQTCEALTDLKRYLQYLREMGIDLHRPPPKDRPAPARSGPDVSSSASPPAFSGAESLAQVREDLGDCRRCKLHQGRKTLVFGEGNETPLLMFVGEGPGYDEDVQGRPFVGRAGQLLTKIIESIKLRREDVYIANIVKCRPPQNRTPEPDEINTCSSFLFRQIGALRPRILCALGSVAVQALLKTTGRITALRGRVFDLEGIKLIPTYHPAYLLRNPEKKRETWEDMKLIASLLEEIRKT
jgi:uracil-DNA glycosylase